ncbi:hypothetical protein [Scleromatobacter humisilvae]|uniref:Uncharacterized protein n=1 Tax=Scleromatobacter humisilvae TaxID=2897159 RepID=A0A9X1YNW1_9BURK|nr:hypothetical protein [Scleromatobacter humisilvae]MCK9689516.1 hypothetical protein [Scleromatobacter humisilvae]
MSGALSSVMGGSGGGSLLGDIGGIIGGAEFGPIGAMVGQALGNMLQQAIQGAMSQATSQLQQQGMPSYVANMVNDQTAAQTAQNTDSSVPADIQQQTQDQYGAQMQDLQNQLGSFIVGSALQHHKAEGQSGKSGGWLEAIAAAMGEVLGQQASDLVSLSNKMSSEVQTPSTQGTSTGAAAGGAGGSNAAVGTNSNNGDAKAFNKDMADFQALSQQYSILQNTFTTAIKSLGDALSGMARKN